MSSKTTPKVDAESRRSVDGASLTDQPGIDADEIDEITDVNRRQREEIDEAAGAISKLTGSMETTEPMVTDDYSSQ